MCPRPRWSTSDPTRPAARCDGAIIGVTAADHVEVLPAEVVAARPDAPADIVVAAPYAEAGATWVLVTGWLEPGAHQTRAHHPEDHSSRPGSAVNRPGFIMTTEASRGRSPTRTVPSTRDAATVEVRKEVQTITMTTTVKTMNPATEAHMLRFAQALNNLARGHGLSNLRVAGEGQLVADIAKERTLLDIARFEIEAQAVLQARVSVISSRAELASQLDSRPLVASSAA